MRFAIILPVALVLTATSISAQVMKLDSQVSNEADCGAIALRTQMVDTSDMSLPVQRVRIHLQNLASKPIVSAGFTLHYRQGAPGSQDSFGTVTQLEVGAKQETVFAETTSVLNPVSYVAFDSVKYADGSSWHPTADSACKVVPSPLKN
jgi:hypothetical protein